MQDTIWTCRDGRQVLVGQMDDQHLHNAIAMIYRNFPRWRIEYLDRLLLEVTIRSLKGA